MLKKWLKRFFFLGLTFYLALCAGLYFFQEKFLFHPYALESTHTFNFRTEFEEKTFLSSDDESISAIHFKADNPKGIFLFFHGNTGNIQVCGPLANAFIDLGYDVLMHDYRSFGKSTGELTLNNMLSDAQLTYNDAKKHFSEEQIIIYGQSIGTGVASHLASQNNPSKLYLEAPYYSIENVAKNQFPYAPIDLILKYNLDNAEYLKNVTCDITIFHGTQDYTIPVENSRMLKSDFPKSSFVEIPEAGHNDLARFPAYWAGLTE